MTSGKGGGAGKKAGARGVRSASSSRPAARASRSTAGKALSAKKDKALTGTMLRQTTGLTTTLSPATVQRVTRLRVAGVGTRTIPSDVASTVPAPAPDPLAAAKARLAALPAGFTHWALQGPGLPEGVPEIIGPPATE